MSPSRASTAVGGASAVVGVAQDESMQGGASAVVGVAQDESIQGFHCSGRGFCCSRCGSG